MENVISGQRYKCEYCEKTYKSLSTIRKHYLTHNYGKSRICHYCQRSFLCESEFKIHIRTHTGETPFECYICDKKFPVRSHLNVHLKIHFEDVMFPCDVCGKSFKEKTNLKKHMKFKHTENRPYSCGKCGKSFKYSHGRKRHEKNCNMTNDMKILSSLEVEEFFHENDLTVDPNFENIKPRDIEESQLEFKEEKPNLCYICINSFERKSDLIRHIKTHNPWESKFERTFECCVCEKRYSTKTNLNKHLKKEFICIICEKGFLKKYLLDQHMNVHTGKRPYACKKCGSTFRYTSNVKHHEKICKGQSKFQQNKVNSTSETTLEINGNGSNMKNHEKSCNNNGQSQSQQQNSTDPIFKTTSVEEEVMDVPFDNVNFCESDFASDSKFEIISILEL